MLLGSTVGKQRHGTEELAAADAHVRGWSFGEP